MGATDSGFRILTGTIDSEYRRIRFVEFSVLGWRDGTPVVSDDGELLPISEIDAPGSDCVSELLTPGEIVTPEMKADIEEKLRLRFAHFDLCDPNTPLKELSQKGDAMQSDSTILLQTVNPADHLSLDSKVRQRATEILAGNARILAALSAKSPVTDHPVQRTQQYRPTRHKKGNSKTSI